MLQTPLLGHHRKQLLKQHRLDVAHWREGVTAGTFAQNTLLAG
jgi:hypothetical protein